jgi:hypothetical protein
MLGASRGEVGNVSSGEGRRWCGFHEISRDSTTIASLHLGSHIRWWCCGGLCGNTGLVAIVATAVHHTTKCTLVSETDGVLMWLFITCL